MMATTFGVAIIKAGSGVTWSVLNPSSIATSHVTLGKFLALSASPLYKKDNCTSQGGFCVIIWLNLCEALKTSFNSIKFDIRTCECFFSRKPGSSIDSLIWSCGLSMGHTLWWLMLQFIYHHLLFPWLQVSLNSIFTLNKYSHSFKETERGSRNRLLWSILIWFLPREAEWRKVNHPEPAPLTHA